MGENFHQYRNLISLAKSYLQILFSCVNNSIEDVATFTVLVKMNFMKCFCHIKVAGLGKIFLLQIFRLYHTMIIDFTYMYMYIASAIIQQFC